MLRLKHLLYVEGLTLAGARRKLSEELPEASPGGLADVAELLGADARERLMQVRQGLRELSVMLGKTPPARAEEPSPAFELEAAPVPKAARKKAPARKR